MPELAHADPRHQAQKSRNALRQLEPERGPAALAAIPGKTTLTAAMAPTLGANPIAQLHRLTAEAMRDVPALEAANQRGDVSQALAVMASVRRFATYAPALLAELPAGAAPDLEANVRELHPRAVAALEAGPRLSRDAMDAARRSNYAKWDAEVSAWRAAQGTGKAAAAADSRAQPKADEASHSEEEPRPPSHVGPDGVSRGGATHAAEDVVEGVRDNAVPMGHESHKAKFEFKRGQLTGAIGLTLEEGKTGIPLGDDDLKAFKNTSSMKVNGFVAKLETALLNGKLDSEILDGVKIEFEANALKASTDGHSVSTDPLTIGVKLTGDVTHWWDIGRDVHIKLEGGLQLAFGGSLLAKHLAKVTAAEIEQRMLTMEVESVSAALAKHTTAVKELRAELATAASRGLSHQEVKVLKRQLLAHTNQVRAGAGQLQRLSGMIAEAQVRAARSLGGVRNFVARKVGRAMEVRAAKFVAAKLIKLVPILNAVSMLMDIVDLVVIVHALIKGKYSSRGDEGGDGKGGDGLSAAPAAKANRADSKRPAKSSDEALHVARAAPPALIGRWFEARGEELTMNDVGEAWKAEHQGARMGDEQLEDVETTITKNGPARWDLHLVFVVKVKGRRIRKMKHDFMVSRDEKKTFGARVGDLAFEPYGMVE